MIPFKTKIFKIFLLNFLLFSIYTSAQTDEEGRKSDNIRKTFETDTVKAIKMVADYKNSPDIPMKYWSRMELGRYYRNNDKFAKAKEIFLGILTEVPHDKNAFDEKSFKHLMAKAIEKIFFIEKALGNSKEALGYVEQNKNYLSPELYTYLYNVIRIDFGDYELGIRGIKEDITSGYYAKYEINTNKHPQYSLANRYNTIGEAYQKWYIKSQKPSHWDSADHYFKKATTLLVSNNFMPEYTKALFIMRTAKNYVLRNNYKTALQYYKKRNLYPVIKEKPRTEQVFDLGMADCFLHLNEMDSSIVYTQKYLKLYNKINTTKERLLISYHILSKSYAAKKQNDSAYFYAKKCLDLTSDLERNHFSAGEFIHDYDVNSIAQSSKITISKIHNRQLFLIGFIIIILGIFLIYLIRLKKINKEKHNRFLTIISELKSKETNSKNSQTDIRSLPNKSFLDEEQTEQISKRLIRLENKLLFLKSDFKLAFVAKKLNTNTAYLSQYFNQHKNQTFSEYLQKLRIEYVLEELKNNSQFRNYTIQAIAEEIGYKDSSTFLKAFKKHTGITPRYYIQELEKNNTN